jgi:hypothetical protein
MKHTARASESRAATVEFEPQRQSHFEAWIAGPGTGSPVAGFGADLVLVIQRVAVGLGAGGSAPAAPPTLERGTRGLLFVAEPGNDRVPCRFWLLPFGGARGGLRDGRGGQSQVHGHGDFGGRRTQPRPAARGGAVGPAVVSRTFGGGSLGIGDRRNVPGLESDERLAVDRGGVLCAERRVGVGAAVDGDEP